MRCDAPTQQPLTGLRHDLKALLPAGHDASARHQLQAQVHHAHRRQQRLQLLLKLACQLADRCSAAGAACCCRRSRARRRLLGAVEGRHAAAAHGGAASGAQAQGVCVARGRLLQGVRGRLLSLHPQAAAGCGHGRQRGQAALLGGAAKPAAEVRRQPAGLAVGLALWLLRAAAGRRCRGPGLLLLIHAAAR